MNMVLRPASPDLAEVVIAESPFIIGRHHAPMASSKGVLATAQLSRRHACIFHEAGLPYLVDMRSRYGTTLNGGRVGETPVRLRHGDELCFAGCLIYTVAFLDDDAAVDRPSDPEVRLVLDPHWKGLRLDPIVITRFPFLVNRTDKAFSDYKKHLPEDVDYISRHHAYIFVKGRALYIEDLRSTNGTFVAGLRLKDRPALLKEGDAIAFGSDDLRFIVHLGGEADACSRKTRIYGRYDRRDANRDPLETLGDGADPPLPGLSAHRCEMRQGPEVPALEHIDVGRGVVERNVVPEGRPTSSTHSHNRHPRRRRHVFRALAAGFAVVSLMAPFVGYTISAADGQTPVRAGEYPSVDHRAAFEKLNAKLEAGTAEMRRQARKIARLQQEAAARQSRIAELERRQSVNLHQGAGAVPMQRSYSEVLPVEPRPLPRESFGAYHALLIGSDRYRHLPRLDTAVNDVTSLAEVLSKRYGFETTTLIDADRYQILSALNKLRGRLTDRDNLIIYYAGHGELDEINQRGQWLPVDAELDSTANWISNAEVTDILNTMSAKHVLLIADSCYSGALTRASPQSRIAAGMSDQQRLGWIRIMVERRSRIALTSGGLEPVVDSGSGRHSVFAKALLEALGTNTEVLDGQRLFAAISGQVTYAASQLQVPQVPEYAPIKYAGHDGGEFFFVPTLR